MAMLGMAAQHVIDEAAQEAVGLRRMKAVDLDAVAVGDDGGEAAHLVPPGDAHVLVGIDVGQQEFAATGLRQRVQARAEHAAGAAPVGADVHQHRPDMRGRDHRGFEIVLGDVDDGGGRRRHLSAVDFGRIGHVLRSLASADSLYPAEKPPRPPYVQRRLSAALPGMLRQCRPMTLADEPDCRLRSKDERGHGSRPAAG